MNEEEKKNFLDRIERVDTWREAGIQALETMDKLNKEVQHWKSKFFSLEEVVKKQAQEIEKFKSGEDETK